LLASFASGPGKFIYDDSFAPAAFFSFHGVRSAGVIGLLILIPGYQRADLKIENTAPCGSAITDMRPTPSMVIGGI